MTFNFSSQTAWQQNHRYYNAPLDGDFSPLDIISIINDYGNKWNNVKAFTEELRFSSPANNASALKWTAGAYFFHQDVPNKQQPIMAQMLVFMEFQTQIFLPSIQAPERIPALPVYGQLNLCDQ
jgi:iron complex outermembrane receptor protein